MVGPWIGVALGRRRVAWIIGALLIGVLLSIATRWRRERPGQALVVANAALRISPHPATTAVGEIPAWTRVQIERRDQGWVRSQQASRWLGSAPSSTAGSPRRRSYRSAR